MYSTLPTFILGFHGCDQRVVDDVVCGRQQLRLSENDYDWLGHGIYFWENDPVRAYEYAIMLRDNPRRGQGTVEQPAVLGAVIDLGYCMNLMESSTLQLLSLAYSALCNSLQTDGEDLPRNLPGKSGGEELLLRYLDCAVIEFVHKLRSDIFFDSIRGLFIEGEDLYPNAGFKTKNHIQVCVRNPNCIKGYFIPRTRDGAYPVP